ncbi:unnamed protein product [Closterium sp. NIES-54]
MAPKAGEDFQAMVNPAVVLLDSGCSHHLMGTKEVFVDLQPNDDVKEVRGFNGALQTVQGCGTIALQGKAGKQVLIPDVLYVLGVHANLLSAGQLKENGVRLQEDGTEMLLVSAVGDVLGRASYTGQVLYTDLRPCSAKSMSPTIEVVALRAIVSATKSTPDGLHAKLTHVAMDTIRSLVKHEVATGLDLKSVFGADSPCVSCVGGKLAQHTFPDKGSDADDALAVMHIDLCGPFRVAAKDGSLYILLLKDRKTRYVWARPVAKKSDVLREFEKWMVVVERQTKKSVLMLRSDRGGEFLGRQTVVEFVRTMLLHMGVQYHWWHLALWQAIWVRNNLERSTLPPGTTPHQLLTCKKPDLMLSRVWGCMAQFLVPEQQRDGNLKPKARWRLHLGVLEERKGWELLDLTNNRVVTTSDVVFYEKMLLEVWKSEHGPVSGRTQVDKPTDTSTATLPLLAEVGEIGDEDAKVVHPHCPYPAPPLVADLHEPISTSASGDEGSSGALPVAPAKSIAGGRRDVKQVGVGKKSTATGEQQAEKVQPTWVKSAKEASAEKPPTGEQPATKPTKGQSVTGQSEGEPIPGEKSARKHTEVQQDNKGSEVGDDGGNAEESTDSDVVEVEHGLQCTGRLRQPPDFFVPTAFSTVYDEVDDDLLYDNAKEDEELPELDPDMHADLEHRCDISTMTVKEALASWKGKAWVLTTKYRIDDTVEHEKARLVVKGFTQVYSADYDETYALVSSYVTLRIFLSIVAILELNLMQLDMKKPFLQSKLDRVLYMYQPDHFNDETGRVCKLLKSLYGLKQWPLLWYRALDGVLLGAGWKKSQVDTALYFKVGRDGMACWVLVYVDDLLASSSSTAMLKELKELLEAAFELWEILPVQKYLWLEIVCDRSARNLWLHQQGYADKMHRRFIDKEQTGRTPKTPDSVDTYAELTFDNEEVQESQEEEYRLKVSSLQLAATTTRPDIAFACSKLGRGLTVRSDQHWREVVCCLAYLADTRDTALGLGGGAELLKLVGYVYADDVDDKQNRTSTGGFVFVSGGDVVSWSGQRIKCLLDAWTPTVLRVDNKSAVTVAEGLGLQGNLKHMERRYAWQQHMVKLDKFFLNYIPTTKQPANFLTKALHYLAFNWCSVAISQLHLPNVGNGDNDVQQ